MAGFVQFKRIPPGCPHCGTGWREMEEPLPPTSEWQGNVEVVDRLYRCSACDGTFVTRELLSRDAVAAV